MLKRLLLGLLIGAIVGGLVAAGAIAGLGAAVMPMGPFFAFVLAAATGVLTGLVAGKPIWAKGGQIEAARSWRQAGCTRSGRGSTSTSI